MVQARNGRWFGFGRRSVSSFVVRLKGSGTWWRGSIGAESISITRFDRAFILPMSLGVAIQAAIFRATFVFLGLSEFLKFFAGWKVGKGDIWGVGFFGVNSTGVRSAVASGEGSLGIIHAPRGVKVFG